MAVLVRTRGSRQGKWVFPLKDKALLGRLPDCDVYDVFQGVTGVSRHHAEIRRVGDQHIIQDKGSRNGTLVNGERLQGDRALHDGDCIGICGVELTYCVESDTDDISSHDAAEAVALLSDPADEPRELTSRAVSVAAPPTGLAGYSAEKLRALAHMLKRLGGSLDIDETLSELLAGLFAIFPQAERGFVAFGEKPEAVTPRATHYRGPEHRSRLAMSRTITNHVLAQREAVLWTDYNSPSGLATSTSMEALEIHSVMCAPLLDGEGQPFGLVQIDSSQPSALFTADDLEVMAGAVSQAAVAVRFARLHEDGLRRLAIERDLQLARRVQLSLLPASCPPCEGYEFFTYYQTAYEVGGDYYDFIELPSGRLAVVVADVAGKGVSAALCMAKLSGELKYYLSCETPRAAIARMNDSVCNSGAGRFVTLLLAILERTTSRITLINAGHLAPLRRRASGRIEMVGESQRGLALGILTEQEYSEVQVEAEPGDVWFVCTDGFTEALGANGEMYGMERLQAALARDPVGVQEMGERIVQDVERFVGDQQPSDDMCLVGWGRLDNRPA
jgi:sigma-B regulation protein RsbU (phosphoserine phosphatase)